MNTKKNVKKKGIKLGFGSCLKTAKPEYISTKSWYGKLERRHPEDYQEIMKHIQLWIEGSYDNIPTATVLARYIIAYFKQNNIRIKTTVRTITDFIKEKQNGTIA